MESDGLAGSLIILAFILMKVFFTVGETAVTEISESKVKSFENGSDKEKRLFKLLSKPAKLITAFSVNRIFSAVLIAYTALIFYLSDLENAFAKLFYGSLDAVGDHLWIPCVSIILILLLTVLVLTVFCDGLPKRLASSHDTEKLAVLCAAPIKLLVTLLTPLSALSNLLVNLFAKLFGIKRSSDSDVVTEEEILMMVDAGNETGVIEQSQKEMINNVFEFNDLTASDVMTHRTDIVGVENTASVSEVVNAAISSGFSRIPVYENSMDHIIGIICVKDLLCMVGSDAASTAAAKDFVREVIYVPDTMLCGELFKQLSKKRMQMAVVADEYGGTAGLVTMEDVVESVFGSIQDEYDDETEDITQVSDDTYIINGTSEPGYILEQLGITLPEDNDFETMSGFIVNLLGRIPEENENPSVQYKNVLFTVLLTEDMCITKLKASILKDDEKKENSENDEHEEKN